MQEEQIKALLRRCEVAEAALSLSQYAFFVLCAVTTHPCTQSVWLSMADNRTENRSLRAEIKAEHAALRDEIERLKVSSDTAEHGQQQQQFPMLEEFSRLAREQQETQEKLAASEALLAAQQEKLAMVDSYTWDTWAQDRESVPPTLMHSFEQAAFRQQRHEQLCRLQQMSDEGGASNELAPEVICA